MWEKGWMAGQMSCFTPLYTVPGWVFNIPRLFHVHKMLWCGKINGDWAVKTQYTFQCFDGCNGLCHIPKDARVLFSTNQIGGNLINLHSGHVFIRGDLVAGHWHYSKEWTKKPSTTKHRRWLMVLVSILCRKCHYWNLIEDYNWIMTKDTFCLRFFTLHMMKREDVNSALFGDDTKSNGEAWSHGLCHKKQTTGICHSAQFASPNSTSTMLHNFRRLRGRARLCLLTQT